MFSRTETKKYTNGSCEKTELIAAAIKNAEAIVVGAGAGLSTSAGFDYSGERFKKYFSDFEARYGFHDMYSGGFYPYKTSEEYWAFWSRYIFLNRYSDPPKPTYNRLLEILKGKEYFVITTNVDHCFQKAGFEKDRLFYTQGDYGLFQCSKPCREETFDNKKIITEMVKKQENMKIPSELIPHCPHCGREMTMNLRCDDKFVEDVGWHMASERYAEFLRNHRKDKILFLEFGVGYNTPGIIKYPFWQMTASRSDAAYICINKGDAVCPNEIKDKSLCLDADITEILQKIKL